MQALALLAFLAATAAAATGSPSEQLGRFDSFPDAACRDSSRRGTARVLRGEDGACRTFSAELGLGAKAIRITPTPTDDDDDRAWAVDVYTLPFCMENPVTGAADGACLPAPAPGTHWMSYKLRLR